MSALSLLLLGCSSFFGMGSTSMKATGDAPFALGKVESALWVEGTPWGPGSGDGILLMTTTSMSCDTLFDELDGRIEPQDSVIWKSSGILASFEWWDPLDRDKGFEGTYIGGLYPLGYGYNEQSETLRLFDLTAFAEGAVWSDLPGLGLAELHSYDHSQVTGQLQTDWVKARFQAKACGQQGGGGYTDSGWFYN